jgi:hypothetical protein
MRGKRIAAFIAANGLSSIRNEQVSQPAGETSCANRRSEQYRSGKYARRFVLELLQGDMENACGIHELRIAEKCLVTLQDCGQIFYSGVVCCTGSDLVSPYSGGAQLQNRIAHEVSKPEAILE